MRELHRREMALQEQGLRVGTDQPEGCRGRMKRMTILATVSVALMGGPAAHAQGVPVFDGTAVAQFVQQLEQMRQDYEAQLEQLTSLQDQLESITGTRGSAASSIRRQISLRARRRTA